MNGLIDVVVLCWACSDSDSEHAVHAAPTPVPGLVVHEAPHEPGTWTVTHARSGCSVSVPLSSPEGALHVAVLFGECGDWERSGLVIRDDAAMHARWKAVLD